MSRPPPKSRSATSNSKPKSRAQTGPGQRVDAELERLIQPDGLAVRRRRHDHGWSPRDLVAAIATASFNASGLRKTLTPNQLQAIEERAERIPYAALLLLADGLDCDPTDLLPAGNARSRGNERDRPRPIR